VTLPIPSNVFADGELTNEAKWYTRIFAAINSLYTQVQDGNITATATGPASQTDYTTIADVISLSVPMTSGRTYRCTASAKGLQITASGITLTRLKIGGVEYGRCWSSQNGAAAVSGAPEGTFVWYYQAPSTASVTVALTAEASAGAMRISASACQLTVEDAGV
jgi:hypothetical protein